MSDFILNGTSISFYLYQHISLEKYGYICAYPQKHALNITKKRNVNKYSIQQ